MQNDRVILAELKGYLQEKYGQSVKDVILFGSQARGNASASSDYDILILLDKDYSYHDKNELLELCFAIGMKHDIVIDAHFLSVSEMQSPRGKQPIFENALKSGIYA